jgi:redox-sensitive bicupin YhaK (pirin superfamily)
MIRIVKSDGRGKSNIDWLNSRFSFSFAEFYDERMMHFGPLRVLNDDYIAPGGGFPMHPHKDMEIITYVVEGGLRHADSMGSSEIIGINQI